MKNYTYLLIDILAILVPFIFSFHPKIRFHATWKSFFPSVFFTALIFLSGDALYTRWGVWGFNPDYLTGIYIGNLPLEELLFFFCIPYACIFTYHCLDSLLNIGKLEKFDRIFTPLLIVFLLIVAIVYYDRLYTFTASAGLASLLLLVHYWFKPVWLGNFYIVYAILLVPFMFLNGLLTGTALAEPIVWYNNNENMGFRILTIPFEDVFYGMSLILLNVLGFEFLKDRYQIVVQKVA